ncbi:uncharacterized protein LOC144763946 [Lissotriton helveticus]
MTEIILSKNYFLHDSVWYHQIQGTAMGSKFAPAYAGLFMGWFEREHAWGRHAAAWMNNIIFWGRYIDDVIMIWDGPTLDLSEYFGYLNDNPFNVRFTMTHNQKAIDFLDVQLFVENNKIQSCTHRKATACNSILHYESAHPRHVIENIPYGEMIRMRRNCSTDDSFQHSIQETEKSFLERGYPKKTLEKANKKVQNVSRTSTLTPKSRPSNTSRPLSFTTQYSDQSSTIFNIIRKHWHLIADIPSLKDSVTRTPKVCYRRGRNLRNILCPSYVESKKRTNWLTTPIKGFFTCSDCNMCALGKNRTKEFCYNTNKTYTIDHLINCNTKYVVYILGCDCNKIYVGSTKRALKTRIQEHVRARRNGDMRHPLTFHMQEHHKDTDNLWFLGIDHQPTHPRGGNRELALRQREAGWICRLRCIELGHNTEDELHHFLE